MAEEYIKKSDAINAIKSWASIHPAIDLIKEIPAEDVAPVVHAKWISLIDDGESNMLACSLCGELSCCKGNYCPDCGAKMDGE